jgi:SHS2 domain-containing protein
VRTRSTFNGLTGPGIYSGVTLVATSVILLGVLVLLPVVSLLPWVAAPGAVSVTIWLALALASIMLGLRQQLGSWAVVALPTALLLAVWLLLMLVTPPGSYGVVFVAAVVGLAGYTAALVTLVAESIRAARRVERAAPAGHRRRLLLKWIAALIAIAAVAWVVFLTLTESSDAGLGIVAFAYLAMLPASVAALATALGAVLLGATGKASGHGEPPPKDQEVRPTSAST